MLSSKERLLRFALGGCLSTAFTYIIFLIMHTHLNYQSAYLIGYVCGIGFAYLFNALYVFRVRISLRGFLSYPIVYIIQYVTSAIFLEMMVRRMHISETLAPLIITIGIAPLTYILSKLILNWTSYRNMD